MSDSDETEEQIPKRRGWGRFLRRAFLVLAIPVVMALAARWQLGRIGQKQLDQMTAHLDATEPGWRLADIESAREKAAPEGDRNPSTVVIELNKAIPAEWKTYLSNRSWDWGPMSNYQPSFYELIWLLGGQEITADIRLATREKLLTPGLLASPGGRYVLIHNENPLLTLLPDTQNARNVAALLSYDARLLVLEKKPNQALSAARAGLVVAKSIGDEPYLISQLVRIACDQVALQTAMQVLALCEPTEGLAELQKALRAEADVPWLQYGLRGERGMYNKLFEGLESGKISLTDLEGVGKQAGFMNSAFMRVYRTMLPGDQAKTLELLTAYLDAARLPAHQQKAAFEQIKLPTRPPEDFRYIVTSLLMPACGKVAEAAWRGRADLLTSSTAIACERFRQSRGRWPASLAEIPRDILPDIPIDPFNGEPIQYQQLEDGVAVFSVGDARDRERRTNGDKDPVLHLGRGWKLWNKELRNLPHPLPAEGAPGQ